MTGKYVTERLALDETGLARAVELLDSGGLVALPTETVYGLAARADRDEAVKGIYAAKGRPSFNPLIVHVAELAQAEALAVFDDTARDLAARHWPGPLTLVLPRRTDAPLAEAVTAGLPTIALRMPAHPVMRTVLRQVAAPLAAPSANRSGAISPTSADHVLRSLAGRIDAVVDAGDCEAGLESTIVAVRPGGALQILRPGPIVFANTEAGASGSIEAPGQLARHYAPGKPVRLNADGALEGEYMIGFAGISGDCTLSISGDLVEAASRLYACLHEAALSEKPRIAVAPIPGEGMGLAINDRLRRAAA